METNLLETLKMDRDEFAKFIAIKMLASETLNFHAFYVIRKITDETGKLQDNRDKPMFKDYDLFLYKDGGCDMVEPDDSRYAIHQKIGSIAYRLAFCFNELYFSCSFCHVRRII